MLFNTYIRWLGLQSRVKEVGLRLSDCKIQIFGWAVETDWSSSCIDILRCGSNSGLFNSLG